MRKIGYFFLLALLFACNSKNNSNKDQQIIPINQMREIVWDMLKADEYYIRISAIDSLDKTQTGNLKLYDQVFKAYGISKKQFYNSYQYYQAHPALFKTLIDSVDALSSRQRAIPQTK
jgi:hypothetical protein